MRILITGAQGQLGHALQQALSGENLILKDLPVSETLRSALLDHTGHEGEVLAAVMDYERGLFPESLPLNCGDVFECWQKAVLWADALRSALPEPQAPRSKRRTTGQ